MCPVAVSCYVVHIVLFFMLMQCRGVVMVLLWCCYGVVMVSLWCGVCDGVVKLL
jgi:hypothetical protein